MNTTIALSFEEQGAIISVTTIACIVSVILFAFYVHSASLKCQCCQDNLICLLLKFVYRRLCECKSLKKHLKDTEEDEK